MLTSPVDHKKIIRQLEQADRRRYRSIKQCGEGGHAYTYVAEDSQRNQQVAIKVLKSDIDGRKADVKIILPREALRSALVGHHPNIVRVYDFVEFGRGTLGIVMEYVPGGSLRKFMAELSRDIERSLRIAAGICRALARLHEHQIVHRDVKPENILMWLSGSEEVPKITDFGIARESNVVAEAVGALYYMAPECLQGDHHSVDPRSDLYSLGVVLYEMLQGHPPFRGENTTQLIAGITSGKVPAPDDRVPTGLRKIVQKGLQRSPSERYQTANEMLFELETYLEFHTHVWIPIQQFEERLFSIDRAEVDNVLICHFLMRQYLEITATTMHHVTNLLEGRAKLRLREHADALDKIIKTQDEYDRLSGVVASDVIDPRQTIEAPLEARVKPSADSASGDLPYPPPIAEIDELLIRGSIEDARKRAFVIVETGDVATYFAIAELFFERTLFTDVVELCLKGEKHHGICVRFHALRGKSLYYLGKAEEAKMALALALGYDIQADEIYARLEKTR